MTNPPPSPTSAPETPARVPTRNSTIDEIISANSSLQIQYRESGKGRPMMEGLDN